MKTCYPKRAQNLPSRVLNGEAIVMKPSDSTLFNLNETATAIWQAANGTLTLREIVERHICSEFEVDPETALIEAEELACALAEHSILILEDAPS